jgi:hypothetical protein
VLELLFQRAVCHDAQPVLPLALRALLLRYGEPALLDELLQLGDALALQLVLQAEEADLLLDLPQCVVHR